MASTPIRREACSECGGTLLTHTRRRTFSYGRGVDRVDLHYVAPALECQKCGLEVGLREGERAKHVAICEHLELLTPREIVALRERYGWSQEELAEAIRCGEASISRWETGAVLPNRTNDLALRMISDPVILRRAIEIGLVPAPNRADALTTLRRSLDSGPAGVGDPEPCRVPSKRRQNSFELSA